MKITLLQCDLVWASPAANQLRMEATLNAQKGSDVYVLPEMFSTGFATEPAGIAETDCCSLKWMQRMAKELDAAVCGSVSTELPDAEKGEGGKAYYNRFYFVKPDGEFCFYDKHHLFTYGGEHHRYTRGDERVEVEFRGVRFLLQVCYDLRFPIYARNKADNPYDVALYVASWPESRLAAWNTLLHARAIENQCYVMGVNRVGDDEACHYAGGTIAIDAYGRTIAECENGKEGVITVELDLDALAAFRKKFPVLHDGDC